MNTVYAVCFWASAVLIAWLAVGYPLFLRLLAVVRKPSVHTPQPARSVSLLIAVYNEEKRIEAKLRNCGEVDYPKELFELVVVSDASNDATDEIVHRYPFARLIRSDARLGKDHCLALAVATCSSEVIAFTDASALIDRSAIRALAQGFDDPGVGCVSGWDVPLVSADGLQGESLYVRYEMLLREMEAKAGTMVSASGCLFAARKSVCDRWPEGLTSDFALPLAARLMGLKTVCSREAVCRYPVLDDQGAEGKRKVRTILHGLQAVAGHLGCLNPLRVGLFAFQLFSHKLLRWLLPWLLLLAFVASALLAADSAFYAFALAVQLVVYTFGAMPFLHASFLRFRLLRWMNFFLRTNGAIALAWLYFFTNDKMVVWEPTRR